jgi:uncharacterized Zn finger protein
MRWGYYRNYVPVAERRKKALKKVDKLCAKGEPVQPIAPFNTRGIAESFWGKAWCRHLESFSDYENRLPRGRTYIRNGSVCHLSLDEGTARALVSGSELYELSIHIQPLDPKKWAAIKARCQGRIGSLIELLQGKISDEIMAVVTDRTDGLFPQPGEIRFNCNCPDWADMCKHVAAAMYGIGVRLDSAPELLFKLRGVHHGELITSGSTLGELSSGRRSRRRTLESDAIESVFGIELEKEPDAAPPEIAGKKSRKKAPPKAFRPTGKSVRTLRKKWNMTPQEFALHIGVSKASVIKWEASKGLLRLSERSFQLLEQATQGRGAAIQK